MKMRFSASPGDIANGAERLIRVAAARGVNLVALPEMFNWRGPSPHAPAAAEALDGDWLSAAFQTRLNIVDHQGVHLWRPAVPPARLSQAASPGLNEGL